MTKIRFATEAEADLRAAIEWYGARSPALVGQFLRSLEAAIAHVAEKPDRFAFVRRPFRRFLLNRFPYALLYIVEDDAAVVVAVFHCSRDPRAWERRTHPQ